MNSFGNYVASFLLPALRTILFIAAGFTLILLPSFHGMTLSEVSKWWVLLCIGVNLITIALIFILLKKEGRTFHWLINYNPDAKWNNKTNFLIPMSMLLLGIGGMVGASLLIYGHVPLTNLQPLPLWAAIIVLLFFPITTALAEIPFYLGYCSPKLKSKTKSKMLSIAYPLFFFALQHSFMPLLPDPKYMLLRFLQFSPLLVMMGIWYKQRGDLFPLIIGHGILDTVFAIQLLIVSLSS